MPVLVAPYISHGASGVANVLATNLQVHYTFDGVLTDETANNRDLTATGTPTGFTSDGYRLDGGDTLESAIAASDWYAATQPHTIQMVWIVHTVDAPMGMQLKDGTPSIRVGTRSNNTGVWAGAIFPDGGGGTEVLGATANATGTAVMLTLTWTGSDTFNLHLNRSATADGSASDTGSLSPKQVLFDTGAGGSYTLVYAVGYNIALSDAQRQSNYDEIKTVVNTRPGVGLP